MHAELNAIVDQVEAADPSQKPEAKALSNRVDALAQLHDAAEHYLGAKIPWHERNILLKGQASDLGLNLDSKTLAAVEATARGRLRGQRDGISPGDVFQIPEDRWLAQDLIAARTLTLMVSLQKVGKSAVVCNILGELAKGRGEFDVSSALRAVVERERQLVRDHLVLGLINHALNVQHVVVAVAEGRVKAHEDLVDIVRREAAGQEALEVYVDAHIHGGLKRGVRGVPERHDTILAALAVTVIVDPIADLIYAGVDRADRVITVRVQVDVAAGGIAGATGECHGPIAIAVCVPIPRGGGVGVQ